MSVTRETLLQTIREDGAENWKSVALALEDGAYLKSIGAEDAETPIVEDAHEYATLMTANGLELAETFVDE